MRIVTLEEHALRADLIARRALTSVEPAAALYEQVASTVLPQLSDVDAGRLADMDAGGVTVQVLSVPPPAADFAADPDEGIELARRYNDWMADAVREHPDRFQAFAHVPTTAPEAAADELERCICDLGFRGALVSGTTHGIFLDHRSFEPILASAERLGVPIYLHPSLPPDEVRRAYYDDLPEGIGLSLANAGWGWHTEVALHALRLVLSGALDRHPRLQLIIGHLGEGLETRLGRFEDVMSHADVSYLQRRPVDYLHEQFWVTTSGYFNLPAFMAALMTFGADRILYSVDYPFGSTIDGRAFLDQLPVSPVDKLKIAHRNADALLKLTTRYL